MRGALYQDDESPWTPLMRALMSAHPMMTIAMPREATTTHIASLGLPLTSQNKMLVLWTMTHCQ